MPDDSVMVSISSQSGLHPDEIAHRTFPTARRGVDPDAVRKFLEAVAAELQAVLDREQALRRKLADAERRAAEPELDEATLTAAVGTETARILKTAHDAAGEVVSKAEARAGEILSEAEGILAERTAAAEAEAAAILRSAEEEAEGVTAAAQSEAQATREAVTTESVALTESTRAEAIELMDATRSECRRIVKEARALRASVLSDLASRRKGMRVQLEQLRGGRDTLMEVVDAVGTAVDELRERLENAELDARRAAAEAGDRVEAEEEAEPEPGELGVVEVDLDEDGGRVLELLVDEGLAGELSDPATYESAVDSPDGDEAGADEEGSEQTSHRSVDELFARIRANRTEPAAEEGVLGGHSAHEAAVYEADEDVVEDEPGEEEPGEGESGEDEPGEEASSASATRETVASSDGASSVTSQSAGGTFDPSAFGVADQTLSSSDASATEETVASSNEESSDTSDPGADEGVVVLGPVTVAESPEAEVGASDGDAEALARRKELLGPVTVKLSRALKRALQDDQNLLLDAIRHTSGGRSLDTLLSGDEQRTRLSSAVSKLLSDAWSTGFGWLGDGSPDTPEAEAAGDRLSSDLAVEVSGRLRHRLEEGLSSLDDVSDGGADVAGAAYREWRGARVEGVAGDFAARAFSEGAVSGGEGILVRWVVEDEGGRCPDCDDNSLAGELEAGKEFPTGQRHPPVHPGCRCLLVPITS